MFIETRINITFQQLIELDTECIPPQANNYRIEIFFGANRQRTSCISNIMKLSTVQINQNLTISSTAKDTLEFWLTTLTD